jgi:hypothetical protein
VFVNNGLGPGLFDHILLHGDWYEAYVSPFLSLEVTVASARGEGKGVIWCMSA